MGFPGGSDGKETTCNAGDPGLIPGSGRFPWRKKWPPTPVFLPGEFYGQRSMVGYTPVQFSCSVVSDSLQPYGLQHTRLPCSSPTPGACSNSCHWVGDCHVYAKYFSGKDEERGQFDCNIKILHMSLINCICTMIFSKSHWCMYEDNMIWRH